MTNKSTSRKRQLDRDSSFLNYSGRHRFASQLGPDNKWNVTRPRGRQRTASTPAPSQTPVPAAPSLVANATVASKPDIIDGDEHVVAQSAIATAPPCPLTHPAAAVPSDAPAPAPHVTSGARAAGQPLLPFEDVDDPSYADSPAEQEIPSSQAMEGVQHGPMHDVDDDSEDDHTPAGSVNLHKRMSRILKWERLLALLWVTGRINLTEVQYSLWATSLTYGQLIFKSPDV